MSRKLSVTLIALALSSALVTNGWAQTGAPVIVQPGNTVLIAQYECLPGELAKVDQVLKEMAAPVLNRMVAEGKLLNWGVLGTHLGGPANRTIYVWAKDPVALMQARAQYLPEMMAKPGWAEIGRMCPRQETSLSNLLMSGASTK